MFFATIKGFLKKRHKVIFTASPLKRITHIF